MIRTKLPTHCTECSVKLTSKNRSSVVIGSMDEDLCVTCHDASAVENEHNDSHDEIVAGCPLCVATSKDESKAHAPKTHSSHAECAHESTKAARAKCRRQRKA